MAHKKMGQASFVEAFLRPDVGANRRLERSRKRQMVLPSGVSSSRANPQNRRNDSRSASASSSPSSDREYQRCRNRALSIESGGYDGRPQAPDRTGLTSPAAPSRSSARSARAAGSPPRRAAKTPRQSSPDPSSCTPFVPPHNISGQ